MNRRQILSLRRRHFRNQSPDYQPIVNLTGNHALHGHTPWHASVVPTESAEVEETKDRLTRLQAEFDNFRKRIRRDQQQQIELANQTLVESLLPVLDNFERAIATPGDSVEQLVSGLKMVHQQMVDVLQRHGLEPVEAAGQMFDPTLHEAVATEPPADGQQDGQVVEVFQDGYKLKGRLVRPAMVKVARG